MPLGDKIVFGLDRQELATGGVTKSSIGNQYGSNLHNNAVEGIGIVAGIPTHWQTYHVDIEWTGITASCTGNVLLRWGADQPAEGDAYNGSMDYTSANVVVAPPAVFVKKVTRLASDVVVDPTRTLFGRVLRIGNDTLDTYSPTGVDTDTATASIGIATVILTRSS